VRLQLICYGIFLCHYWFNIAKLHYFICCSGALEKKGWEKSVSTEVNDISKKFGDFQALSNINLTIDDGEFIAILGPSGCGKTTLLRLLAGFESPTDGDIVMDGVEVANSYHVIPPEERNVSM